MKKYLWLKEIIYVQNTKQFNVREENMVGNMLNKYHYSFHRTLSEYVYQAT